MQTEVLKRPKGLMDGQKKELERHSPKEVLSNRINIALKLADQSDIMEEIVLIMGYYDLTKREVIAIFDEQENITEFVQKLDTD